MRSKPGQSKATLRARQISDIRQVGRPYRDLSTSGWLSVSFIAALAHSALALDLYSWLAQRLHRAGPKPDLVRWANIREQLGDTYEEIRMLRLDMLKALKVVSVQCPGAHFEATDSSLLLKNSPPGVRKKLVLAG